MTLQVPPHHPSCKESDRNLVWECDQCGAVEPAELEDELAALYKDRASLNSMTTLLAEARRERDALIAALKQAQLAMQHAGWRFHAQGTETRSAHDRAVAVLRSRRAGEQS